MELKREPLPDTKTIQAYSKMVDKVKAFSNESLLTIWEAIQTKHCPFDYWAELIYSELIRRKLI